MDEKVMSWPNAVLVAIDQLGNAIAGGNPDATVSARVGYFAKKAPEPIRWYWRCLERVIDFTFLPIDGPDHCWNSYRADKLERFQEGSDLFRAVLGVFVILFSLPASVALRLAVLVYPQWHWKHQSC